MTKLNYHKDKNFFMDWLMLNEMSTGEIVLWHTLMNIGNRLGQKSIFNAPTSTVMKLTGLSKQGLINSRKKLMDRGFINYKKGHQNKAPVYEMLPLHRVIENYFSFSNNKELTQDLPPQLTKDSTQESTIHKVQITKEKRRGGSGSARDMEHLYITYEENINKLTPIIREELNSWVDVFGLAIIEEAIRITAKKGGRTFSYTEKILQEWQHARLDTHEAVQTYELEKELEKSKNVIPFRKQTPKEEPQEDIFTELLKEDF